MGPRPHEVLCARCIHYRPLSCCSWPEALATSPVHLQGPRWFLPSQSVHAPHFSPSLLLVPHSVNPSLHLRSWERWRGISSLVSPYTASLLAPRVEEEWASRLWGGGVGCHAGHVWDGAGGTQRCSEGTAKSSYGGIWAGVLLWVTGWLWVTRRRQRTWVGDGLTMSGGGGVGGPPHVPVTEFEWGSS